MTNKVNWDETLESTCYRNGYRAYYARKWINPHDKHSNMWHYWNDGWYTGWHEEGSKDGWLETDIID